MAKGDWINGTRLSPTVVNIEFDNDLRLSHVGVGYHLIVPSGRSYDGGFTWHSPAGDLAHGPEDSMAKLQEVMTALLEAAAADQGVSLATDQADGQRDDGSVRGVGVGNVGATG